MTIHLQFAETILPEPEAEPPIQPDVLEAAAQTALEVGQAPAEAELSLVITNDEEIQVLNRQYLDVDAPTDVLSFPAGDTDPDTQVVYLGDIIISLPRAQAQAAGRHPVEDEIRLLVVHGVLHLLGHDHAEEDEKAEMWRLQALALNRLGCPQVAPPL